MFKEQYGMCNNCGNIGHHYNNCKNPITSIGIIVFRRNEIKKLEYLMIRRKDTIGYIEFMRGKYMLNNHNFLLNIISEMTVDEKQRILTNDFSSLWRELWGDTIGTQYRNEEGISNEKFSLLKRGINNGNKFYSLETLIDESKSRWTEPEWGFPKGRHNYQEKDISCALREFEEETGYSRNNINILTNVMPFEEIFTGSNYKPYKHKYYVAHMDKDIIPCNSYQQTEVSKIEWKEYDEAIDIIRSYNLEKRKIISLVTNLLLEYRLYP